MKKLKKKFQVGWELWLILKLLKNV
jgi:hypothetical protein